MAAQTAVCRRDDEPLVLTFGWKGYEFICMVCGTLYTYFGPKGADTSPELDARHEELRADYDELTKGLIASGAMYQTCSTCTERHAPHIGHATDEEIAAHVAAQQRIGERFPALRQPQPTFD